MSALRGYSTTQIALHWVVALLILGQILFGEGMTEAWRVVARGGVAEQGVMVWGHILGGCAVLGFALWRLALRSSRGVPAAPADEPPMLRQVGHLGHLALYAVMILAPVTGLLAWFGGLGAAAEVHEFAEPAIFALVGLHVAAALWHQFWLKDGLLMRMRRPLD